MTLRGSSQFVKLATTGHVKTTKCSPSTRIPLVPAAGNERSLSQRQLQSRFCHHWRARKLVLIYPQKGMRPLSRAGSLDQEAAWIRTQ